MDNFNILQWNVRSIKSNSFLQHLLSTQKINCAILWESWLKPAEIITINGFNTVRSDRNDGYRGTCLLLKYGINYTNVDCNHLSNDITQISAVKVKINNKNITIISVYSSPNHKITSIQWYNILSNFQNPIIIAGDFNAHHALWGCETTDTEGKEIVELLTDYNFTIMNNGTPKLFQPPGYKKSAVDLTVWRRY